MSEKNYKLTIAYDGTHYNGWQIQPHSKSIQGSIEKALKIILRHKTRLKGAGRTDTGVHALGQTANFHSTNVSNIDSLQHSLNGILPVEIRIKDICEVPKTFHSQYSAISKTYHYHLWLEKFRSPFHHLYSHHVRKRCDIKLLHESAQIFIGTHDFKAFANSSNQGSASKNPIRTIYSLNVLEQEGGIRLEFYGNGFLYKMVRNIVGTMLDVSLGKRAIEEIPRILASRDRRLASRAAPALGLFLVGIDYPL